MLVAFLGGCSAFYQEPEPLRTASTTRVAPTPGPSVPTWGGPGPASPGYQLVDQGAKDRMNVAAQSPSLNMPRTTNTNPVSVYNVQGSGGMVSQTTVQVPDARGSFPSAHLSGPARNDPSMPQVIMGQDSSKPGTMTVAKADKPSSLPAAPSVPSVTSKDAPGSVFMITPAPKPSTPSAPAPALTPPPPAPAVTPAPVTPAVMPPAPSPVVAPPAPSPGVISPASLLTESTAMPVASLPPAPLSSDKPAEKPTDLAGEKAMDRAKQAPSGAMMRVVNNRHITLNFKVEDVGPSGVSNIEVWSTQDCKTWKKHEVAPNATSYAFDAEDEGIYGFTILAKSGIGLGKEPPQSGDLPQVWVLVDTTRPVVQVLDCSATLTDKVHTINIQWRATDKNLGSTPITISYAEKEDGPWTPIASRIENTGNYIWKSAERVPAKLLIRVEATDLAGNIGVAQTAKPLVLDPSMPNISILGVEGGRE